MRKTLVPVTLLATLALAAAARPAAAGGSSGSIGVGAEYMLGGPGGVSLNYDGGKFHAGGFFGFRNNDFANDPGTRDWSDVDFGGRFYFHVHSTAMSDFGVGGQLGFVIGNRPTTNADFQYLFFDAGAQMRIFVVSNVALSATLGLSIGTMDANGVELSGQPVGGLGLHYYFF